MRAGCVDRPVTDRPGRPRSLLLLHSGTDPGRLPRTPETIEPAGSRRVIGLDDADGEQCGRQTDVIERVAEQHRGFLCPRASRDHEHVDVHTCIMTLVQNLIPGDCSSGTGLRLSAGWVHVTVGARCHTTAFRADDGNRTRVISLED